MQTDGEVKGSGLPSQVPRNGTELRRPHLIAPATAALLRPQPHLWHTRLGFYYMSTAGRWAFVFCQITATSRLLLGDGRTEGQPRAADVLPKIYGEIYPPALFCQEPQGYV